MIVLTLTFVIVYLISIYWVYTYTQYAHYHPEGRWTSLKPNGIDIIVTITPVINTIVAIWFFINGWQSDRYNDSNFFKPKKPLK